MSYADLSSLLLCTFILLNSMATKPDPNKENHKQNIFAEVQEGYDIEAPQVAEDGTTPSVPTTPWAVDMADKLQGVVVNRLRLNAAQMESDASRVVITLPISVLFAKDKLVGAELVRALMMAAQGSRMRWQVYGAPADVLAWSGALAAVTGQAEMREANIPVLKVVVTPSAATHPTAGRGLQGVTEAQGATIKGESTR